MHASRKITTDAILIVEREAAWNVCAALDHVVALLQASPNIRWTEHSLFFVCFHHMTEKYLGLAEKTRVVGLL